jgi:hypothetical protein
LKSGARCVPVFTTVATTSAPASSLIAEAMFSSDDGLRIDA